MATDERLDVGVVIVTFNSGAVIPRLLDSLEDGLKGLQWRAVVVDNASTDDTVMVVDAAGFEVLSLESNNGYAAAINRGIRLLPDGAVRPRTQPRCRADTRRGQRDDGGSQRRARRRRRPEDVRSRHTASHRPHPAS